jgi:hypothetical protein
MAAGFRIHSSPSTKKANLSYFTVSYQARARTTRTHPSTQHTARTRRPKKRKQAVMPAMSFPTWRKTKNEGWLRRNREKQIG